METIDGGFVAQLFFFAAGICGGVRLTEDLFAWRSRKSQQAEAE